MSTRGSFELNHSVDDYGQAPDLKIPPTQDVEITPWLVDSLPQDPRHDMAPWLDTLGLDTLDEIPPTPPPKSSRMFNVSPQTSLTSMRNGNMSSYYYSNGHRSSTNLSITTINSLELNDLVDDYGQAFRVPELDLPPPHDIEITPWLVDSSLQDPPSPPPKSGRTFHFLPKGSFSSVGPGSSSGPRNIGIDNVRFGLGLHDRSFAPTPELRKSKSSMFSSLREVYKKILRPSSNAADESDYPTLPPPPLNTGGSQEIQLDCNLDEMDGIIDLDILNEGLAAGARTKEDHSGEGLRSKDDDLLNDKQETNSISPVDAFLDNLQRREALLAQSSSSADLRDALQSYDRLIGASLSAILDSRDCKNAVLLLEADRAQSFLDAAQNIINRGSLSISHTSQARRLVVRLSAASEQLPSSLFISGVTDHDDVPTFCGGFGDVYRASYGDKTVALKRIRIFQLQTQSESKRIRLQFCREALVWQTLQHEYILPLIGIDRETFLLSFCMVSPWMKHGTVLQYLSQHGRADVDKLLLQVAEGLGYLHSMKIVHGDLRGTNILVSDQFNACLADFGLTSVIAATTDTSSTNHAGSTRWWAPELIQPSGFGCDRFMRTPSSDVYAFACVCLELHTGRPPFFDAPEASVIFKVIAGERPARPDTSLSDDLWALVTAAWAQNFCDRPDIKKIIGSMRTNAGLLNHG